MKGIDLPNLINLAHQYKELNEIKQFKTKGS